VLAQPDPNPNDRPTVASLRGGWFCRRAWLENANHSGRHHRAISAVNRQKSSEIGAEAG